MSHLTVPLGPKSLGPGHPTFIIAEIGGNFRSFEEAAALIDAAALCGVDAVKLQTYRAETLSSRSAMFDMENTGVASQFELFKAYEVDRELHRRIFAHVERKGLVWFSTPSHESDVDLLEDLGVPAHKIGSDDAVNLPLLSYVARKGRPVLLSTGMCTLEEVRESVSTILGAGNEQLVLLHAVTSYPTHPEHVNLRAMVTLAREFGLPVGYSDHTLGTVACVAAAALGAHVVEKHFTLDKSASGPDHRLSADPAEMRAIVEQIRALERMLGDGVKRPAESERKTRLNNRKSLIATRPLRAGDRLSSADLAIKRPGLGIPPKYRDLLIGRTIARDVAEDEVLTWEHLG